MISKILRHFIALPLPQLPPRHVSSSYPRDPLLEAHARSLLGALAPELATRVAVRWNRRLRTTAGLASYEHCEVMLHPGLREISEAEVEKTLRHELAHLLAQSRFPTTRIAPHGAEWRQACIDLGISNESRTHQLPFVRRRQQRKFLYRCPSCEETLSRARKPRRKIACLRCCRKYAGGRYDERFRYEVLIQTRE